MTLRVSPPWWPALATVAPVAALFCFCRNLRYLKNRAHAAEINLERLMNAEPIELPELEYLEVSVLSEWEPKEGFLGEPGVSYLFRSDRGTLLYDVGFGPDHRALGHNAEKLGVTLAGIDAVAISHLHPDHMGGMKATMTGRVKIPQELGLPQGQPCFLPDQAGADGFDERIIDGPGLLAAGFATTGPLARSLFFAGWTEEQALLARIKGKGLVVFTGCGHPTIELIVRMARRLSHDPIYAIGGGLHFPVTQGRGSYAGIQIPMIIGTGKPPWQRITEEDLEKTILAINEAGPKKVYLSAHDTCDYGLKRFHARLAATTEVLRAGATYTL